LCASNAAADEGLCSVILEKRFLAKALPEPDLKYRSRLRAVASSATATYERRIAGRYLHVEVAETEGFEPSIGLYNPITV
jgi:hypothetical protein